MFVTRIFFFSFSPLDSMVLEGLAVIWSSRPGQVPAVCHWHIQGSPPGFCSFGRHERHPEVPDPPWWSIHWPPAICSHLVSMLKVDMAQMFVDGSKEQNFKTVMFCFSSSALTSWTFQPTRATRSWDICCCWPFRNAPRDSDWLKLWDS